MNRNYAGGIVFKIEADDKDLDKKILEAEKKLEDFRNKNMKASFANDRTPTQFGTVYDEKTYAQYKKLEDELTVLLAKRGDLNVIENEGISVAQEGVEIEQQKTSEMQKQDEYIDNQSAKIDTLTKELYEMLDSYKLMQNQDIVSDQDIADAEQLKSDILETAKTLEEMTGSTYHIKGITDASPKLEDVDNKVKKIQVSANGVLKKLTRWGLAIFGVRSAYMLIRQAINVVSQGNEKLGGQLDGIKQSFFMAFEPVVKRIINLIRTLMAYINSLWNALFGHVLFAEKGTNNINKNLASGAKSAKEINNQLSDFDEANVLSSSSSGSGSGIGGGNDNYDLGLSKIKLPDWWNNLMKWVEKHQDIAKVILGLAPFVLFGLAKLGGALTKSALAKILGKAGAGATGAGASGLLGILGTMLLIAATVVICKITYDAVKEAIQAYKDLREEQKQANSDSQETAKNNVKLDESWVKEAESVGKTTQEIQTYTSHIRNTIRINKDKINSQTQDEDSLKELKKENEKLIATYQWLYDQGMLTQDQEYQYYQFLRNEMAEGLDITNEKLGITKESFDALDKKYGTEYLIEIKTKGKDALDKVVSTLKGIFGNNAFADLLGQLGSKTAGNLKSKFDSAANYFKKVFKGNGGIINFPGSGVPIPYIGERGREGIVPMDNQQEMAVLGREIGKWVVINNYVTNNVDSRKLNQILKQSENRERLANNG